jgi:predicted Rossmann fold nucleotide-binding protein DprA/Smf involved in DNA uptake
MDVLAPHTQAALLLAAHFGKATPDATKPLTPAEWDRLSSWCNEHDIGLADLLEGEASEVFDGWHDSKIPTSRLVALLGRGAAMAVAVEKWARSGVWIVGQGDADYPRLLKTSLGGRAPAVFFGCGNRRLLNAPGWAVVGSRNASMEDLDFATQLGALAAESGRVLVSGGARGVDEAAMRGALKADGTAVGILADSLLKAVLSRKYRGALQRGDLLLISPYYPGAGFSAGNAMGRNKYIYCMSELAFVVHSGPSGGTWTGANEAIKKGWGPVWVKRTDDPGAGNEGLVKQGARWLPDDVLLEGRTSQLLTPRSKPSQGGSGPQLSIFEGGLDP